MEEQRKNKTKKRENERRVVSDDDFGVNEVLYLQSW